MVTYIVSTYLYVRHDVSKYYDFIINKEDFADQGQADNKILRRCTESFWAALPNSRGLKIGNGNFIYENMYSALYYFPKILYALRKLQLSFDESALGVARKYEKEFPYQLATLKNLRRDTLSKKCREGYVDTVRCNLRQTGDCIRLTYWGQC